MPVPQPFPLARLEGLYYRLATCLRSVLPAILLWILLVGRENFPLSMARILTGLQGNSVPAAGSVCTSRHRTSKFGARLFSAQVSYVQKYFSAGSKKRVPWSFRSTILLAARPRTITGFLPWMKPGLTRKSRDRTNWEALPPRKNRPIPTKWGGDYSGPWKIDSRALYVPQMRFRRRGQFEKMPPRSPAKLAKPVDRGAELGV